MGIHQANLHPQHEYNELRARIRDNYSADEAAVLHGLVERIKLSQTDRQKVAAVGAKFHATGQPVAIGSRCCARR